MFKFIKQIFFSTLVYFGSLSSVNPLECISMKNQECKVRPETVNINSNNPIFYPFSIKTNKCSGNCNNINDPYARICTPDVVKNLKLFVINNTGMMINVDVNVKIWNPINCECGCDKSCDIGEYLDYSNCKCRKKLADLLVEECTENINETSLVKKTLDKNENKCNSYVVYKVLFWSFFIFFIINFRIGIYFVYCNYVNCNKYELPY